MDIEFIVSYLSPGDLFVSGSALDVVIAVVDRITVQVGPKTFLRGYTGGHERVRINFNDRLSLAHGQSLVRLFIRTAAPVSHLHLTQAHSIPLGVTFAFDWQTFTAFPLITHLSVHSPFAQPFLQALNPSHHLARGSTLLHSLRDLGIGFTMHRGDPVNMSLRRGEITSHIAKLLRKCCNTLSEVPMERNARGSRLSRAEFFWYDDGCMDEEAPPGLCVDLAELNREWVEDGSGLKPLRELVDGPVIFAGFRFLPAKSVR